MTHDTLKAKAQEFLKPFKDNNRCPHHTYINNFVEYCNKIDKDIENFVSEDFTNFLKPHTNPHTASNVKSIVGNFLEFCGLSSVANELHNAKEVIPEFGYLQSFDDLVTNIDEVYYELYKPFGNTPQNPLACDNLTLGEVVLYLAWIGVPRDSLVKLPLEAINLKKQCIEYQDGEKHYEFSFVGNQRIAEVFERYKKSKYFTIIRQRNGKPQFVNGEYYGDSLIRVSSPPKDNSNAVENMKATLSRIFQNFKFAGEYKYVYYSGACARGLDKIRQGILPVFTTEGIMDYFGIVAETYSIRNNLKNRWENYLVWRSDIEGRSLDIDIESIKKSRIRNLVLKRLPDLNEYPEDNNTEITVTIEKLEDLLQAAYNLGSADLNKKSL